MFERRLQVFVSSTYTDLREERQAAVEAILSAGHIPAGMELFAAGDESQLEVIKHWIDDSDVFFLILGGRYGSIEPNSGRSYVELEYEHARSTGKPMFCCVLEESEIEKRLRERGSEVFERNNQRELAAFRARILTRLVKLYSDIRDVKLAVHESLGEFERRSELVGWIRGDRTVNAAPLAEELARLTRENSDLRSRLETMQSPSKIAGIDNQDMKTLLDKVELTESPIPGMFSGWKWVASEVFGSSDRVSVLHAFWSLRGEFSRGVVPALPEELKSELRLRGLVALTTSAIGHTFSLTQDGFIFLNRLEVELSS
jgi:hypothetical protein